MEEQIPLIDSHCHIDLILDRGVSLDEIRGKLRDNSIQTVIQIASDPAAMEFSPKFCRENSGEVEYFYTIGLHPNEAHELDIQSGLDSIRLNSADPRFVAVGEVGLDYFHSAEHRTLQLETFERYILAAIESGKPLVVHTRHAHEDTLALIKKYAMSAKFLIHCSTGNRTEISKYLDLGAWISFSGIVTFKNALDIQEAAKYCPLDKIMVETDAPFLAPVPHRGKVNQPGWVRAVADFISELRGEKIQNQTVHNTKEFFSLK